MNPSSTRVSRRIAVTGLAVAAVTALGTVSVPAHAATPAASTATAAHALTNAAAHTPVHASAHDKRGEVVDFDHLRTFTADEAREWLASETFDPAAVRYGVDTYRLIYRTVDVRDRPTTASGLLVLPRNGERRLRTVSYTHGTMSVKEQAPSTADDVWGPGAAVTYGGAGFAAVAPDYLGLGKGPGVHPWKNVPSETTAALDMLRAARNFVPSVGRELERDVLITGFSQGASPALGLARALQEGADPWFRARAVAPISGGYDFPGAQLPAMVRGELHPKMSVAYTSYLFTSWDRIHGLYETPDELFRKPYASRVEKYFDGTTPGDVMLKGLPGTIKRLLTPRGKALLRHPTGTFAQALREDASATMDWTPRMPVRLYKAAGDEQATTANTDHLAARLRARGAHPEVIDVGGKTYGESLHLGSNLSGTARVAAWFSELR
ncbi:hypothetical protein [Actinomadura hibisca]|uniref:hypothetical protein n=1 Tax=Actinomadura hibisca TaxID=68565 RepID=UPI00082EBBB7|nr:hypothetical protein [Actinomadura hibisca]